MIQFGGRTWSRGQAWAALAVLVVLVQASFLWASAVLQRPPLPYSAVAAYDVRAIKVALLPVASAPPRLEPLPATAKPARLPFVPPEARRDLCLRGTPGKSARVQFEKPVAAGHGPQALLVQFAGDNVAPYVNGVRLAPPRGKFDARPSRDGRQAWLLDVPETLLVPGINTVDLLVAHNGCLPILTNVMFGERGPIAQVYDRMAQVRETLPWLAVALTLIVGLAVLFLLPIADDRHLIIAFSAMMFSIAARSYYSVWSDWRFDHAGYTAVGAVVAIVNGACIAWLAQRLGAPRWRAAGIALAMVTALHLAMVALAWWNGWTAVLTYLDTYYLPLAALYTAAVLLAWFRRDPVAAIWPLAVFSVYVLMTIWTQVTAMLQIPMMANPRHLVPFYLAVGLGAGMIYRGYNLYRDAERARASLAVQVAEKEQEIRSSYLRLREQERLNTIQTERQRLISDMHDGVSGQLAGLLMLVRGGNYAAESLPGRVQAIITDLRLIIDSMDSAGDTLGEAIANFRSRVAARMRTPGLEITWDDQLPADATGVDAASTLQIYRVLQEAIANVVKHAQASEAAVALRLEDDGGTLAITVSDNGRGIDPGVADGLGGVADGGGGRGLGTMRKRIAQLGGDITFTPRAGGGTVVLARIPLQRTLVA